MEEGEGFEQDTSVDGLIDSYGGDLEYTNYLGNLHGAGMGFGQPYLGVTPGTEDEGSALEQQGGVVYVFH